MYRSYFGRFWSARACDTPRRKFTLAHHLCVSGGDDARQSSADLPRVVFNNDYGTYMPSELVIKWG